MIWAIIQARMGSTRLPGKIMKDIEGKAQLWHVVNRTAACPVVDRVVVATTDQVQDDEVELFCREQGIVCFRGSERDVLDRYYQVACMAGIDRDDAIVRITADCPVIDPEIIRQVVELYQKNGVEYASNVAPPTYPDGLDVEVFSFALLKKTWQEAATSVEREHVTPYMRSHPRDIMTCNLENDTDLSYLRWTVDEPADLEVIRWIYANLYKDNPLFSLGDILALVKRYPEMGDKNRQFKRNEGMNMNPRYRKSQEMLKRALLVTPLGAQTYSKSYRYFCEGNAPAFIERGEGCYVWDVDGNRFVDFICALGPVTVGYNDKRVNQAIIAQLEKGICFSQPAPVSVDLAERLVEVIPCAEMVRFVKNGSDATASAVRLARAFTGRDLVVACGYHGMQDWYIGSTANNRGIPQDVCRQILTFTYNDFHSLQRVFDENPDKIAAVIMEPIQGDGPAEGFLQQVKELTQKSGALLIFDEVVSGFRYALGGASELYGIVPDLAAFGKGMGNGLAISAVAGRRDVMELIGTKGVFISTTFGGEALALAGALEVLKILSEPGTYEKIWALGDRMLNGLRTLIARYRVESVLTVSGLAPHAGLSFEGKGSLDYLDIQSLYSQKMTEKGILTVGINNICLSHSEQEIDLFLSAAEEAFRDISKALEQDSVAGVLLGGKINPIFKRNIR